MRQRLFLLSVMVLTAPAAAQAVQYRHRAFACTSQAGPVLRLETEVERDSEGRPMTEDQGFARIILGTLKTEGIFKREGQYYHFQFPKHTLTVDSRGGTALLYTQPNDPQKIPFLCRATPLTQGSEG